MDRKDRKRVEEAARKAGWAQARPYTPSSEKWCWYVSLNNGLPGEYFGWLTAHTERHVYLLAARLLGVRVKKGGK